MNLNKSIALVVLSILVTLAAEAKSPQSDREFAGLKGKVHQVSHGNQMPHTQNSSHSGESETYDEAGNLMATVTVGDDSYLQYTYVHIGAQNVFEYWNEGPASLGPRKDDSNLSAKFIYKYDHKGNRIEKSIFNKEGLLTSKQEYKYDSRGRLVSQSLEKGGQVREVLEFTRDEKNNVIALVNDSQKTTYIYVQFDSSGNWIKRLANGLGMKEGETQPSVQNTLEERFITYY